MRDIKQLLPIGSIINVKGTEKKLMVIGILMNNNNVKYDYMTVPFPEGYMDQEHMYLVNHEDIDRVLFLGYINADLQVFRGILADELSSRETI